MGVLPTAGIGFSFMARVAGLALVAYWHPLPYQAEATVMCKAGVPATVLNYRRFARLHHAGPGLPHHFAPSGSAA